MASAPSMLRIERLNYILGGILIVAATLIYRTEQIALGVAVGVVLTCANFFVLRRLVTRWTHDAAHGKPSNASLLMLPKMVGLMVSVVLALMFLPIDPIAFTVGYSTFIVSIILDTSFSALRPPPNETNENGETHG
ncbi:MAG: synthase [Myxococcales bacterium]|nr:synthase [Myxococcales bacterium]